MQAEKKYRFKTPFHLLKVNKIVDENKFDERAEHWNFAEYYMRQL
jgi:hypothetical protein